MTAQPILLFLHGVGDGDPEGVWRVALSGSLVSLGYPTLDEAQVIAPRFAHLLKGADDALPLPPTTPRQSKADARIIRRDFEQRVATIEHRLGRSGEGSPWRGSTAMVDTAVGFPMFAQASNYVSRPEIRAQVLAKILGMLPDSGSLVIVGHSLGSVIATDLLRYLPSGIRVTGMVTIGSPLGSGRFDVDALRQGLAEPPAQLQWWVNFWDTQDPIAAHRGVSSAFPWMLDRRVDTGALFPKAHQATSYFGDSTVATAIGYALFGSLSRELERVETGLNVLMDTDEKTAMMALRYAHLLGTQLDGDVGERFRGALRRVQTMTVNDIIERNRRTGRGTPHPIARLAVDTSHPATPIPVPAPHQHVPKAEAVVSLTALASVDVLHPFDIDVPLKERREAMQDLTAEMGLGNRLGADVFDSIKEAHDAVHGPRGGNWIKWAAIGAGALALVAATGGLALAAAPGLAGAAAITGALAAFGPGGMIGGLITAGTLATAGGGGILYGIAAPGMSAEVAEAVLERQLAPAILRKRQGLDPDPELWRAFVEFERVVSREHERLDEFSDRDSPVLKNLQRKIRAVERALDYLSKNGLEP